MQSMIYNARWMHRFERIEAEQEDGDCVAEFREAGRFLVSIRPVTKLYSSMETGEVHTRMFQAWVNDTHAFKPGDRLGEKADEYTVVTVVDNYTGQKLEVAEL